MSEFTDYEHVYEFIGNRPIVAIDLETTGLSAQDDHITEIGAIKYPLFEDSPESHLYNELINPGVKLPQIIVEITGITDELLANKPSIKEVLPRFLEFLPDNAILVMHNAVFDYSFLVNKYKQYLDHNFDYDFICTKNYSSYLFPNQSHKLAVMAKQFSVENPNHHRATNDAIVCCNLLRKLVEYTYGKDRKS